MLLFPLTFFLLLTFQLRQRREAPSQCRRGLVHADISEGGSHHRFSPLEQDMLSHQCWRGEAVSLQHPAPCLGYRRNPEVVAAVGFAAASVTFAKNTP